MYNLEGQTDENWNEDLWFIEKLGFTGCSIYPLLPFPNAPLVKSGKYNAPHPENEYRLFKLADVFLTSLPDWEAITAVQYGHKSHGNAKYVELQADDADILALGPGAGGKINGIQYFNAFTSEDYLTDNSFTAEKTKIFRWQADKSALAEKLRFCRKTAMPEAEFKQVFENDLAISDYLFENALIMKEDDTVKLTQTGKYWSANIAGVLLKN